jgi:hypothetical protein
MENDAASIESARSAAETLTTPATKDRLDERLDSIIREEAAKREVAKAAPAGRLKSLTHAQLKEKVASAPGDIVAGLLPEHSVNIIVGDSGLGKTPLLVQKGLCVAAGIPFLGQPCRKGRVLYVDYENGLAGFDRLLDKLCAHLGLEKTPDDFRVLHQPATIAEVYQEVDEFKPDLVLIDAMRGFDPAMEKGNTEAGIRLAQLEKIATRGPAFVIQHHIRKDDLKNPPPPLLTTDAMVWLLRACGARALINQTNVRLAIDAHNEGEAELIIKGHYKLIGAFGPLWIGRKRDEDGEPIGYHRLTGPTLLSEEQRAVYAKLPSEFRFTDVVKGKRWHQSQEDYGLVAGMDCRKGNREERWR